jgi:hypothetical protein
MATYKQGIHSFSKSQNIVSTPFTADFVRRHKNLLCREALLGNVEEIRGATDLRLMMLLTICSASGATNCSGRP